MHIFPPFHSPVLQRHIILTYKNKRPFSDRTTNIGFIFFFPPKHRSIYIIIIRQTRFFTYDRNFSDPNTPFIVRETHGPPNLISRSRFTPALSTHTDILWLFTILTLLLRPMTGFNRRAGKGCFSTNVFSSEDYFFFFVKHIYIYQYTF